MIQEQGSRIFLSRLPVDVGEKDVEELFRKTVGPLKESFLVYNSQGNSKGMAVVTFQRPGDALAAQAKYDGKIVDGRRPIKIEIISDGVSSPISRVPPPTLTLLNRLSPANTSTTGSLTENINSAGPGPATPTGPRSDLFRPRIVVKAAAVPPRRIRQKKGPKRLKKRAPLTIDDLDKEMEEYRAAAPDFHLDE
jgi:THO complex subunit 4